jgi:hypothetical protein
MHEQYMADLAVKHKLSELEQRTLTDYYLSFHFSQGIVSFQTTLLGYTAMEYSTVDLEHLIGDHTKLDSVVSKLTIPRRHGKLHTIDDDQGPKGRISDQFNLNWQIYLNSCLNARTQKKDSNGKWDDPFTFSDDPSTSEYELILHGLFDRDIQYMAKPRPRNPDPHQSFVKTYAIDKTPTRSIIYDRMFGRLNQLIDRTLFMRSIYLQLGQEIYWQTLESKVNRVKKSWESFHPGQVFV